MLSLVFTQTRTRSPACRPAYQKLGDNFKFKYAVLRGILRYLLVDDMLLLVACYFSIISDG